MRRITTLDGNLFKIAAVELGSALQWVNIARANNLKTVFLTGQQDIQIPDFSVVFDDGIGPQ